MIFPSIQYYNEYIFADNIDNTQVINHVLEKMIDYYKYYNIDSDTKHDLSFHTNIQYQRVRIFVNQLLNNRTGTVSFGYCLEELFSDIIHDVSRSGSVVVSQCVRKLFLTPLQTNDLVVWKYQKTNILDSISDSTTLVVLTHVCHITGYVFDIKDLTSKIKAKNPRTTVVVDGTYYMPYGLVDVYDWNVDIYFVSFGNFFGPQLYGMYTKDIYQPTRVIDNAQFYSLLGIQDYVKEVVDTKDFDRHVLSKFYEIIDTTHKRLITKFDSEIRSFKICDSIMVSNRFPIFSLKFKSCSHRYVTLLLNECDIICNYGIFDSILKQEVVQLSFAHYNTLENVSAILNVLSEFDRTYSTWWLINKNLTFTSANTNYDVEHLSLDQSFMYKFDILSKDIYQPTIDQRILYSLVNLETNKLIGKSRVVHSTSGIKHFQQVNIISENNFKVCSYYFTKWVDERVNKSIRYAHVYQIRVYVDTLILTIPEDIQQRDYNYVGILCVDSHNITGAEHIFYDTKSSRITSKQLEKGGFVMFDNHNLYHKISDIHSVDKKQLAYLDVLVITTVF